jgi:hypothetical protein
MSWSAGKFCFNWFENCFQGNFSNYSSGTYYENTYIHTEFGVYHRYGEGAYLRGNTFWGNARGVEGYKTLLQMKSNSELYGRNIFKSQGGISIPKSNIWLDEGVDLQIDCGYNKMSPLSSPSTDFHLYGTTALGAMSINVDHNEWRSNGSVIHNTPISIIHPNNDLMSSKKPDTNCVKQPPDCSTGGIICPLTPFLLAYEPGLSMDAARTEAENLLNDPTASDACRKKAAERLLLLAAASDSATTNVTNVITPYTIVLSDVGTSADLGGHVRGLKGVAFEMIGQWDSASHYYSGSFLPALTDPLTFTWQDDLTFVPDSLLVPNYTWSPQALQDIIQFLRRNYSGFISRQAAAGEVENASVPGFMTKLEQNIPNPFEDETEIPYSLEQDSDIYLGLYDALGNEVMVLFEGLQSRGNHRVNVNTQNIAAGTYYYRLTVGQTVLTKQMIVVK